MSTKWLMEKDPAEASHPLGPSAALSNLQTHWPAAPRGLLHPRREAGGGATEFPAALLIVAKKKTRQLSITEWTLWCTQGPPQNLGTVPAQVGEAEARRVDIDSKVPHQLKSGRPPSAFRKQQPQPLRR